MSELLFFSFGLYCLFALFFCVFVSWSPFSGKLHLPRIPLNPLIMEEIYKSLIPIIMLGLVRLNMFGIHTLSLGP